jgi:hypothetical protein
MPKLGKKKRFMQTNPFCCFCGGTAPSTTIDHVPPKACFPDGYWPDNFEFPACDACNRGSKKDDALAGFYTQQLGFNEANRTAADIAKNEQTACRYLGKLSRCVTRRFDFDTDPSSWIDPNTNAGCHLGSTPFCVCANDADFAEETHPRLVLQGNRQADIKRSYLPQRALSNSR